MDAMRRIGLGLIGLGWMTAAVAAGQPERSAKVESVRLPPVECVAAVRKARVAGLGGDVATELAILQDAVTRYPEELSPVTALIDRHRRLGLPDTELDPLRRQLASRLDAPRPPDLAIVAMLANNPTADPALLDAIIRHLERRVAEQGLDAPSLTLLAATLERLGRYDAALRALERLHPLRSDPGFDWDLFYGYSQLDRLSDARALLEASLPSQPELRLAYVLILGREGQIDRMGAEAERLLTALEAGAELGGTPYTAQRGRTLEVVGFQLYDAGRIDLAKRAFELARSVDPTLTIASNTLAHLFASPAERLEKAAATLATLQEANDPQDLLDEGIRRLTAGDAASALELLRQAAPLLPDSEPAWFNLGMAAYKVEDWTTAASALEAAAKLNATRIESALFAGLAHFKLDRCRAAAPWLERALELDPARTNYHQHLAICYGKLGDAAKAAVHKRQFDARKKP